LETIIEAVRRPMGEEKQLWLLRFLLQYVNGKRNKKVSSVLGADLTVLSRRILSKVASEINI
ncbi:MAG: hypothetical protein N2314_09170, partial [Brevinematales bacterium]|nr:hypothetical protein [Brevinematales bacterium]